MTPNPNMQVGKYSSIKQKSLKAVQVLSTASEIEIAYLAGIIDGEGTVTLRCSTYNGYTRTSPQIEICNTDALMIAWLQRFFWQKLEHAKNGVGRPYMKVHLTGLGIAPFIERILPHLTAKKLQAILVLEYIALRKSQRLFDKPTDRMKEIVNEIRILNNRIGGVVTEGPRTIVRTKYGNHPLPSPPKEEKVEVRWFT